MAKRELAIVFLVILFVFSISFSSADEVVNWVADTFNGVTCSLFDLGCSGGSASGTGYYNDCVNGACVQVPGYQTPNQCTADSECKHLTCSNGACTPVNNANYVRRQANDCTLNTECSHTECVNWACSSVANAGNVLNLPNQCTADINCDPCLTDLGFCFNSGICTRDNLTTKHCRAYTLPIFMPGLSADSVWISVNSTGIDLQEAITLGKLKGTISGGIITFDKYLGHTGNQVWIKLNGTEETLQQAINTGNLCCFNCTNASLEYAPASLSFGHYATTLLISNQSGSEESLQQAINNGEFC